MASRQRYAVLGIALVAALAAGTEQTASATTPPGVAVPVEGPISKDSRATFRTRAIAVLVRDRVRAIELAFGETFVPAATQLQVVVLDSEAATKLGMSGIAAYAPESHTLYFASNVQYTATPPKTFATQQYWPWHEEPLRSVYPVMELIDDVLWSTLLQESAREHNLSWPHTQCGSLDIAERLPCEMLVQGVAAHTSRIQAPLFNENRLADIWPENLAEFRSHAWRNDDRAYQNVRNYGGYLLLRPLVREFGLMRTLNYVAVTPFQIDDNNVRLSAERYQRRAEEALAW